jgi:hypothetical protein
MKTVLDPFIAERWIRQRLQNTVGATAQWGGQTVPADAVAFAGNRMYPLRDDLEPADWPYIVWSGGMTFNNWAEELILGRANLIVRSVMRQDKLPAGVDIEDYNLTGYIAINAALQGVSSPEMQSGIVHSCEVVAPYIQLYGEPGRRVSEMGVAVRLDVS